MRVASHSFEDKTLWTVACTVKDGIITVAYTEGVRFDTEGAELYKEYRKVLSYLYCPDSKMWPPWSKYGDIERVFIDYMPDDIKAITMEFFASIGVVLDEKKNTKKLATR